MKQVVPITPNNELVELYREWGKQDSFFETGARNLEGRKNGKKLDPWNTKLKDRIRELRRNGKSWEWIFLRVKKDISMKTLKRQLKESNVAESTARNCYYGLKS